MSRAAMHKVVNDGLLALSDATALCAILRNSLDEGSSDDLGDSDEHVVIATAVRVLVRFDYDPTAADIARVREAFSVLGVPS